VETGSGFIFGKLKMLMVIPEFGRLENGYGKYLNSVLQIQIQMWY
jgi:hypothetical protein